MIALAILSLLLAWVAVRPLPLRWWWRVLIALPLVVGLNEYSILALLYGGNLYFCPEVPRPLLLAWDALSMVALLALLPMVLLTLLRLPVSAALLLAPPAVRGGWRRFNVWVNVAVLVLAVPAGLYGNYAAMKQPEVRELTVHLPHYPKGAAPLKLALLADLHADATKRAPYLEQIVSATNALGADAIVIAGDFVDGSIAQRGEDLQALRGLHAPLGVYGITGNHDVYYGNDRWASYLQRKAGVRMLMNEHVALGPVVLAGVTDIANRQFGGGTLPDLQAALRGTAPDACVVLLAHQPKFAKEAAASAQPVDLQLSGHTHGGQIRLLDRLWALFNDGYVVGLYDVRGGHGMQLYVSRGTSLWTPTALRLGVPSEIVLITLCGA